MITFTLATLPCPGHVGRLVKLSGTPHTLIDTGTAWTAMWPEYAVETWFVYAVGERDELWGDWSVAC